MASNHGSRYEVNSDGMITKNGSILTTKINYQGKLGSNGLYNTNNPKAVNLTNGSYSIFSGREWCTNSNGSGKCYDEDTQYSASDFCDASSSDCNITLYANWLSYYCSYTKKSYPTKSEAVEACTITTSTNSLSKTTTTYSCPSGYTCSGGTCTSTSTCEKTVNGTITTKYYCSHNGSYQDSSSCSYKAGERTYSCNLTCSGSGSCTYTCPSNSAKNGTTCYYYDTSCGSGWTKTDTGTCYFHCAMLTQGVSKAIECDGVGSCSVSKMYCTASNGTTIGGGGSNPNTGCSNRGKRYQCSKPATASSGCNKVYSAGSCTVKNSTGSCASGYTTTETTCTNKIDKDGKKYCDTRDYWKGKSCTANYDNGATKKVDLTCSKTGTKKYYCSATGKYTTSKPNCKKTITEDLISTTTTSYSCPKGYDSTGNLDKNSVCTKTVVYDVY